MDIIRMEPFERGSDIVIYNGTIWLAGQVGDGKTVADQTGSALAAVENLLAKAGSDKSRILSAVIWLADMADFDEMNSVWDAWVDRAHMPTRACGEARLASPELKVEILITAATGA